MQLFFIDEQINPDEVVTLAASDFKHAVQVLRMKVDTKIQIADGTATAYPAKIINIEPATSTIEAVITGDPLADTELPLAAEIICGLPKREKADWIVQKATELGVTRIIFFAADRSIMQWRANQVDKKLTRLQQIAHDAAAQSHRRRVPEVVYSRCLLLDEPTSALDIAHQVDVLALVHRLSQERGLTVIAVLHDINMAARYCDYLVALRGGEMIAQGTPADLMRSETLERIYGIPMGILPHPAGAAPVSFVY